MEDDEDSDENGSGKKGKAKGEPVRDRYGKIHDHPKREVGTE